MGLYNSAEQFLRNKYNQGFLAVLFVGILIRLKYFSIQSVWNDASVHLWYSLKIFSEPAFIFTAKFLGGDYVIPQFVTSFFYLFTRDIFISGKIMALLYAIAGIFFMYLLGSELRNRLTGLIAALIFAFNPMFWFYSVRPLADAPLTAMFVVVAYFVVKLEKERTKFWAISTVFVIFAAMLTKSPAILLLISFFIYLLIFKNKELLKDKAIQLSGSLLLGLFLLANLVFYALFRSNALSTFFQKILAHEGLQYEGLAVSQFPHLVSWYLLPFFVIGLALIFYYKNKKFYFIITSLVVFWIFFELFVGIALDRYMLPIVPFIVLISAFAISELGQLVKIISKKMILKYVFIVAVLLLVCAQHYSYGTALIDSKEGSYTGYQEAGEWIKQNVPEANSVLFAGSWRSIRAFSEREVYDSYKDTPDGAITNLRSEKYKKTRFLFENDLQDAISDGKQVYLEIDIWEYTQPEWYFPLSQKSIDYFQDLGFKPVKVVERQVQTQQGSQKVPVILIFKYTK